MNDHKAPIIYIPHGGGPMPLLDDPGHREMIDFLKSVTSRWTRPDAVLVVSAHWEEPNPTVMTGANPPMLYDYYGFPPESYQIEYPAPGAPGLAETIRSALDRAGLQPAADGERGFDHGVFVPLKLMYPEADIPCLQLSLVRGLDADVHLRLGEALEDLRSENVLVLGSGFSFHNLRAFGVADPRIESANDEFHDWLVGFMTEPAATASNRRAELLQWDAAPGARICHPREEHLLPLHVCAGAASYEAAIEVFSGRVLGRRATALLWS